MPSMELARKIDFIRRGALTKRYHTKHVVQDNTVGHHSFGVAWFVYLLSEPGCPPHYTLLLAAMAHDLAEQVTGDISSPTKRKYPELAAMVQEMELDILEQHELNFECTFTGRDQIILKAADCLDGMVFCLNELELGNYGIMDVYHRYCEYVEAMPLTSHERSVYAAVRLVKEHFNASK